MQAALIGNKLTKGIFMKLTLAALMLFIATSSFAGTHFKYKGISPLNGDECIAEAKIFDNLTLANFSINGPYSNKELNSKVTYGTGLMYDNFDELADGIANGMAQAPTISSKRILFKTRSLFNKNIKVEFKGKSLAEAKSVSFELGLFLLEKQSSSCNDLEIISIEEWNPVIYH